MRPNSLLALLFFGAFSLQPAYVHATTVEFMVVHFDSGGKTLGGEIYKPAGSGPFSAVLYNHGSAPGMLNSQASKVIGPLFAQNGWVFFMPYRRGQGFSSNAGPYIGDEVASARKRGGLKEASATLAHLLATEHLDDQLAAFRWLKSQDYVVSSRIAAAGNSFGGIETILGSSVVSYCAVAAASAASESWAKSPEIQQMLKQAARSSRSPVFLFQAENDYDLAPDQAMSRELQVAGKVVVNRVYPAFGGTAKEGHSFAYRGSSVWFPDVLKFFRQHCN